MPTIGVSQIRPTQPRAAQTPSFHGVPRATVGQAGGVLGVELVGTDHAPEDFLEGAPCHAPGGAAEEVLGGGVPQDDPEVGVHADKGIR